MGARRRRYLVATAIVSLGWTQASGEEFPLHRFDIPAQDLKFALRALAREAGLQLVANPKLLGQLHSSDLHVDTTPQRALAQLLDGTGLVAEISGQTVVIRGRVRPEAEEESVPAAEILVTGTRIKGAPPTFPVTTVSRLDIANRGQNDLGEVIRSLPQNFNGGQNPGVNFGAAGSENVTSGSALNLRGLGADATLTLLDGHRIAYDSANQSIDISAIPVAAIERLEIVPDGASALYGSDAVAGVANVVLRRDFSGLDTRVRLGSSTDGGGFQQEYSLVGGTKWSTGGFIATADVSKISAINAGDRAITGDIPSDTTLYPSQRVQSFVLSGHQAVGSRLELLLDSFYTHRTSFTTSSYDFPDVFAYGSTFHTDLTTYSVAPKASLTIGSGWQADLEGVHGEDRVHTRSIYYFAGDNAGVFPVGYSNRLDSIEASAEGPLLQLPGGAVRLAIGGGYRSVGLSGAQQSIFGGVVASDTGFRGSRHTAYGYGELFVPIFGAGNRRVGLYRLDLTLAGRFEHDPQSGGVFTPKIGLNYEPSADFGFEASWGRSFKEPTLYQQASATYATLGRASTYGAGYPASATVIVRSGANPDLKPERAETWSTTLKLHPARFPGLHLEASYFNVRYKNRILSPIGNSNGALTNPLYASVIDFDPTPDAQAAIVTGASGGLTNNAGHPYDPAAVVAVLDNRFHNLSRFVASGVDLSIGASVHLPGGAILNPQGAISYLKSSQVNLPGGAAIERAGTIYNPPHWRARVDLPWTRGSVTVAPAMNITGGVVDRSGTSDVDVRGMTTFDLTIRYVAGEEARIRGLEVGLNLVNIANRMPGHVPVVDFYYPAYDSANYSAQGRYVGLVVGKRW